MSIRPKLITAILLMSFGFIFYKDIFPSFFSGSYDDCFEIGHIHKHGGACHEAKFIFSYSLFPDAVLFKIPTLFAVQFDLVLVLKNNFETPYLEPVRKPPRFA